MGAAAGAGGMMYHPGQGGGFSQPTPKGKNKLGTNFDKENLRLLKGQMSSGSATGPFLALQNQKNPKSNKNTGSLKAKDA